LHDKGVDVLGLILGKTNTPALRRLEHSRGLLSTEKTRPRPMPTVSSKSSAKHSKTSATDRL
jgi:hypothetical protein